MRKALAVFLLNIVLICMLSACGQEEYKADMEFTYLLPQSVTSLDPQTAKNSSEKTVIMAIFEGLCRVDSLGHAIPGAADKWENNSDYTEFTFNIRDGACWSNGSPLTAYDFQFGIQRALMPSTKATAIADLFVIKNAKEISSGEMDMSELGVTVVDEHTIRFSLESSYKDFPNLTSGMRFMPCNEEFFYSTAGKYGLECLSTRTNGPFTFETNYSWSKTGELYVNLAKTVNYVGETEVLPSRLALKFGDDGIISADPFAALVSGDTDLLAIDESKLTEAKEAGCEIITLNNSVCGLLLNTEDEKLSDIGFREIFLKLINRESLIDRLPDSKQEATGIVPKSVKYDGKDYRASGETVFVFEDSSVINNLSSLLEEYDLDEIPSITIICRDDEVSKSMATELIVQWNAKLDNAFNIEPLDAEAFEKRLQSRNYQAAIYTMAVNGTSPNKVFNNFASSASPRLLKSESFDGMLKNCDFNLGGFKEMEQTILDEYVFYPVYYEYTYYAVAPGVKDIAVTPDTGIDFRAAKKSDS